MAALLESVALGADNQNKNSDVVPIDSSTSQDQQVQHPSQMYTCRMCRTVVFSEKDVESHEAAQQGFRRRKTTGLTSKTICSSVFLAEPSLWMEDQAGDMKGKLSCPNKNCGARLGSLKWTGAQCSCGSWVTPAIQFPKKGLDVRFNSPVGPPPGTVIHASLLEGAVVGPRKPATREGDDDGGVGSDEVAVTTAGGVSAAVSTASSR